MRFEKDGSGPPLVLVHGSFSNEITNWEMVQPLLRDRFTLYAVSRRGRTGVLDIEAEARDVLSVFDRIGEPVFLLGHSYGAHCALAAAAMASGRVAKLVLYEPPNGRDPAAGAKPAGS